MENKIQVLPDSTIKEMIIREGVAPKTNDPIAHSYSGHIGAVVAFLSKNQQQTIAGVTVIEYDFDAGKIVLYCNKSDTLAAVVTGELKPNPDFVQFKINTGQKLSVKEIANHLRMRKVFFSDKDECTNVVEKLMAFKASITQQIDQSNNLKGDKKDSFETKLSHELKMDFKLQIPLFKCASPLSFTVEIMCDIQDGEIKFWLESMDSEALTKTECEKIMQQQIERLKMFDIAIIQK